MAFVRSSLKLVFKHARYVQIAVVVSVFVCLLAVWLPNFSLLLSYTTSPATLFDKVRFLSSAFATLGTAHSLYSALVIVILSVLSGVQIALLVFYSKRINGAFKGKKRHHVSGYLAVIMGTMGVGCVACGSVILTSILATFGASGLLLLLPFQGFEVALVSIVILLISIYVLIQKINEPFVCNI